MNFLPKYYRIIFHRNISELRQGIARAKSSKLNGGENQTKNKLLNNSKTRDS